MRLYSFVFVIVCFFAIAVVSQSTASAQTDEPQFHQRRSDDEIRRESERVKAMNKDRAARIKRDTDRLLALATELKQYVDKTNENVLSVEVIRKSEEVEKLAKSIREKMKEDYRAPDTTGIRP